MQRQPQNKPLSAAQMKASETKHNQKVRKVVKWAAPEMKIGNWNK